METVPSYKTIFDLADKSSTLLENEITDYRQVASDGTPGSVLHLDENLPAVIVPDIHARKNFLQNILDFQLPVGFLKGEQEISVSSALEKKKLNVICVGDGIHTELTKYRWMEIQNEFDAGIYTGPFMMSEMADSFLTLQQIMETKLKFPENFHFLKGNHENILNDNYGGNWAFKKYADEGQMVKTFVRHYYGDDILYLISCYENVLPLVAYGKNYVVSHAEPADFYTRQQLVDARLNPKIVNGLIWTNNDQVKENTVEFIMEQLLGKENVSKSRYFAGHRPVSGKYDLRQNGFFVQIHNPLFQNVALVNPDEEFDPEKRIVSVENNKADFSE